MRTSSAIIPPKSCRAYARLTNLVSRELHHRVGAPFRHAAHAAANEVDGSSVLDHARRRIRFFCWRLPLLVVVLVVHRLPLLSIRHTARRLSGPNPAQPCCKQRDTCDLASAFVR